MAPPRIGTAGWSVPSGFGDGGSQLQRYAARFSCVEINSSFYRPHRPQTYARWAASVPAGFRFAVKAPRTITHDARLREPRALLQPFLEEIGALGATLGPLLIQLPPSLAFDAALAPAVLIGAALGRTVLRRIEQRTFETLVYLLTIAAALLMLVPR